MEKDTRMLLEIKKLISVKCRDTYVYAPRSYILRNNYTVSLAPSARSLSLSRMPSLLTAAKDRVFQVYFELSSTHIPSAYILLCTLDRGLAH